ncbi:hypothetical protein [Paraburkholderia dioscoreae]|uniref:hypothetical protein n=1 Tax=Paraburkholderia dioscoreae TaxID=2604047 RepID=UPI0013EB7C9C|nr:hypothetical protein [Paraburkholderia dioscoreae]
MRRKDLENLTAEQKAEASVIVMRVEQYRRWRVVVNGEILVTGDEYDCLYADLERVAAWLRQVGIETFTVRQHEPS